MTDQTKAAPQDVLVIDTRDRSVTGRTQTGDTMPATPAGAAPMPEEEDMSGPRQDFERAIYKANPPGDDEGAAPLPMPEEPNLIAVIRSAVKVGAAVTLHERRLLEYIDALQRDRDLAIEGSRKQMIRAEALQDKLDKTDRKLILMKAAVRDAWDIIEGDCETTAGWATKHAAAIDAAINAEKAGKAT